MPTPNYLCNLFNNNFAADDVRASGGELRNRRHRRRFHKQSDVQPSGGPGRSAAGEAAQETPPQEAAVPARAQRR